MKESRTHDSGQGYKWVDTSDMALITRNELDALRAELAAAQADNIVFMSYLRAHMATVEHEDRCGICTTSQPHICVEYDALEKSEWAAWDDVMQIVQREGGE